MKKIAILTLFHENYNWGGVLQGYALRRKIAALCAAKGEEVSVELLNYHSSGNLVYPSLLSQMEQYTFAEKVHKGTEKVTDAVQRKCSRHVQERLDKRKQLFDRFTKSQASDLTRYDDDSLKAAAPEYSAVISGSDQVWNPNVVSRGYLQMDVPPRCRKISYAASIARDTLSRRERSRMIPWIAQFDFLSVREKTAREELKRYLPAAKEVEQVLDPALLLTREEWEEMAGDAPAGKRYALAFFFSDSYACRQKIAAYCRRHDLILKQIPHADKYRPSDEKGPGERVYDVGPVEFLKLVQNAECIFTDSFHGTVFSILFEKRFCVFERDKHTKVSKNSRLYDLLDQFGLSGRLVKDLDSMDRILEKPVDWEVVSRKLISDRKASEAFLEKALFSPAEPATVGDLKREACCGCAACASACPKQCIRMTPDTEGFSYPVVDKDRCVSCQLCLNVCPVRQEKREAERSEAYLSYHTSESIRAQSSSGGVFYAAAMESLKKEGVVYGAACSNAWGVMHERVTEEAGLERIMRSKYVQSEMGGVYTPLIRDLKEGRTVLFSGTPCQVAAVRIWAECNRCMDNLCCVDFVCHGVPSPGIWQSYLDFVRQGRKVKAVSFRDKSQTGWHDYFLSISRQSGEPVRESHEQNVYMRTFLSDQNLRPSCYLCPFKGGNSYADLTLADAWKVEKVCPEWADDKGTSLAVVRSQKGRELLNAIRPEIHLKETDYDLWTRLNPSLVSGAKCPAERAEFFGDYQTMSSQAFWQKYLPVPAKKKARYAAKRLLKATGLEKMARKKF